MLKKVNSILFVLVDITSGPMFRAREKETWKRGCEMVLPKPPYMDSFQDPTRVPVKIRYGSDTAEVWLRASRLMISLFLRCRLCRNRR